MTSYFKTLRNYISWYGIRGLRFAAQSKLSARSVEIKVKPPGVAHPLALRTRTTDEPLYLQIFFESEFEMDLAKEPRVIIDCGGHIGFTAIYFANRFPKATIYTLEPERSNFDLLVKNCRPYPTFIPCMPPCGRKTRKSTSSIPATGTGDSARGKPLHRTRGRSAKSRR